MNPSGEPMGAFTKRVAKSEGNRVPPGPAFKWRQSNPNEAHKEGGGELTATSAGLKKRERRHKKSDKRNADRVGGNYNTPRAKSEKYC